MKAHLVKTETKVWARTWCGLILTGNWLKAQKTGRWVLWADVNRYDGQCH